MIPLRDTIPSRRFPIVNTTLIAVNVIIFLFESMLGEQALTNLFWQYGLVPALFWRASGLERWTPLFTSMFLHGGWWHVISNMLALYIFGDNVEDRLGSFRYLVFYLCAGVAAGALHAVVNSRSQVPTVGASGAIAGVLGAYLVLFPTARILTLVPFFYFIRLVQIPALIYLGLWFVSQLFNGLFALGAADIVYAGGVAWWAHIGGFLFGLIVIRLILPRRRIEPPEYPFPPW